MKFLFDLLPIILFFLMFKLYPDWTTAEQAQCIAGACIPGGKEGAIYAATLVAIIASIVQVAFNWIKYHKVENMQVVTMVLITLLGAATIIFQDETFIKWKPTVVNWAFALAFFGSQYIGKKPIIERMISDNIELDDPSTWRRLNHLWIGFFISTGFINLYVAYQYSTETWVNFKLFGFLGMTVVFVIVQSIYLAKHIVNEEEAPNEKGSE